MSPVDMGGQFDSILKLGATPDAPFDIGGPFDWDDCYVMSLFIHQEDATGIAAASAVGKPRIVYDSPVNPAQPRWTMQVTPEKLVAGTDPPMRALQPGPAVAVAAALVVTVAGVRVVQWGQNITLQ
jgi:hypothetical protein